MSDNPIRCLVAYTKIGESRGRKRLWLEGRRLASCGISPDQRFTLAAEDHAKTGTGGVQLIFRPDGHRKVSRRKRGENELPVIDVTAADIATHLGDAERVRVVIRSDRIEVKVHHFDQKTEERQSRFLLALGSDRPLAIGSLAHGGGVLDHAIHQGLSRAGIRSRLAFANELEGEYLEASLANNPVWDEDSIALEGSMEEIQWGKLPKVEILIAGLPCTGASLSGRAKNALAVAEAHETAGSLFLSFLRGIETLRPSVIVLSGALR